MCVIYINELTRCLHYCHMLVLREVLTLRVSETPSRENPPWYISCDPRITFEMIEFQNYHNTSNIQEFLL